MSQVKHGHVKWYAMLRERMAYVASEAEERGDVEEWVDSTEMVEALDAQLVWMHGLGLTAATWTGAQLVEDVRRG